MNIETIFNNITNLLEENHLFVEIGITPIENKFEFEIHRGDWKHDHLRLDLLVQDYLNDNGIRFIKSECVTEEDGSDCYSSIHYYRLLGVS